MHHVHTAYTSHGLCASHAAHGCFAKRLSRSRAGLPLVQGIMHVFDGTAHRCHLANTIKRSMHDGDAEFSCQVWAPKYNYLIDKIESVRAYSKEFFGFKSSCMM